LSSALTTLQAPLAAQIGPALGDWLPLAQRWADSEAGQKTLAAVDARVRAGAKVFPPRVFRALELTPLAGTKVVILGQDPYHTERRAEGLAFSVQAGIPKPPSLKNIFAELRRDLGLPTPGLGTLVPWAHQGVLLLNTALTVEEGQANSHAKFGWHVLTSQIIEALVDDLAPKVFMLWGRPAQNLLPTQRRRPPHRVLEANHPSPLAATKPPVPFIGCGHFGEANRFLAATGRGAVDWALL
jgi:uracil-DNA glycosylase